MTIEICSFFWNDPNAKHKGTYEFTPKHVNRLARGLRENLTIPYRFTCITDNPDGLDVSNIRVLPLWNEFRDIGRCFVRLPLYASVMRDVIGERIANIDLDVAIVGNVDHIFGRTEPFVGYKDTKNPRCYSGALYMMDAGAKAQVYNSFKRMYYMIPPEARQQMFRTEYNKLSSFVGSDQSWQTEVLGEGLPKITQEDGVWDYWSIENLPDIPKNARIVFCNGMRRDLSMPSIQAKHKWASEYWNN
jgi:hypothetical protein